MSLLIEDTLEIPCRLFTLSSDTNRIVFRLLNAKFANRVIPNHGLFISVRALKEIGPPFIFPGKGDAHVELMFEALLFRPLSQQVLSARIRHVDESGLLVSTLFFEDIIIRSEELPQFSE